jgi:hypothetical protein
VSEHFVKQQSGWSAVPHGLWTADVSHGAKCLLGWLHSHESSYLAALGVNRCEREFGGGGQCRVWLRELTDAGFLATTKEDGRYTITLLAAPWQALHKRDGKRRVGYRRATATETDAVGATETAPIEDQCLEEHSEHHLPRSSSTKRGAVDEAFEVWWKLYPKKKAGKGQARERWRKMIAADRAEAVEAIRRHAAWWIEHDTDEQFIPSGNVWLNQRRWEDEQPRSATLTAVPTNDWIARSKARRAAFDQTQTGAT